VAVHGVIAKEVYIMDEENDPRLCLKNMSEDKNIYGYEVAEVAFLWGSSLTVKAAKIRG
jgi:hypothetical protein